MHSNVLQLINQTIEILNLVNLWRKNKKPLKVWHREKRLQSLEKTIYFSSENFQILQILRCYQYLSEPFKFIRELFGEKSRRAVNLYKPFHKNFNTLNFIVSYEIPSGKT